jgi:hypothetical protein
MNGERHQEYAARRQHAIKVAVATHAKLLEWEILRREGLPIPQVAVTIPCSCNLRPYPHFHSDREALRFRQKGPPGREDWQ